MTEPAMDFLADDGLFDVDTPPPISLSDRFGITPFSVLNRRGGDWMDRKRRWMSLGIASEVGRDEELAFQNDGSYDYWPTFNGNTSVFDPVLCELAYRWFSAHGATVLDPFCGGSVRGITTSILGRRYTGVDIRQEQIDANHDQIHLAGTPTPNWVTGDATKLLDTVTGTYDMIFSCPPYADLEVYSDNPQDISTWGYDEFLAGHTEAITDACSLLADNRYAVWVIGDVRDKAGHYRGLHHETVAAFTQAGLRVINEMILVDPVGTAAMRCSAQFPKSRKVTLTHQHVLVFVKGDARKAADWVSGK